MTKIFSGVGKFSLDGLCNNNVDTSGVGPACGGRLFCCCEYSKQLLKISNREKINDFIAPPV